MTKEEILAIPAFNNLDPDELQARKVKVIATSYQTLISCAGTKFPWEVIVRTDGGITAVRVLAIIVPQDTEVFSGEDLLDVIHRIGPERCDAVLIHEDRPYPALIKGYPKNPLRELPGGVVDSEDGHPQVGAGNAAIRECFEEAGADPKDVIASLPLLGVPSPAASGSQLEGHCLYAVMYRRTKQLAVSEEDSITSFELVPLPELCSSVLDKHESMEAVTEVKTPLAILLLGYKYAQRFGKLLFA